MGRLGKTAQPASGAIWTKAKTREPSLCVDPPSLLPMPDQPVSPKKRYTFKAAEFDSINELPPDLSLRAFQPRPDPGIVPADKARIDVRDMIRASQGTPAASPVAPGPRPNDVHALLQANAAHADAAGANALAPAPKRHKRRKRDYIITLVIGNVVFAVPAGLSGFNLIGTLFALGGMLLFSASATWIMWFVMEDY